MKTSNVLATVFFGAMAAAAPFDKRALVTKTELVVETVVVYTTVYGDDVPVAPATTTPGLFFEQPASSEVVPTSTAAYTPPVVEAPASSAPASSAPASSSVFTPAPAPTSTYTPPVVEAPSSVVTPAPEPSSVYTPPAPSSTYVAPAPVSSAVVEAAQPSSAPAATGDKMHGDITIYDNTGTAGACGKPLYDTDMIVALAEPTWGQSTYDVQTGESTNPWCGQKIAISYKGTTITATIMDLCPGCVGQDIDLSLAAWKALTGLDEKTRLQADWWKI